MKKTSDAMRQILPLLLLILLSACATPPPTGTTYDGAKAQMSSAARVPTTSPLQQLFVLNSPYIRKRSETLVARLQSEAGSDACMPTEDP